MNLESKSQGQQHHYVKIYHINVNNYLFKALPAVKHGTINAALKFSGSCRDVAQSCSICQCYWTSGSCLLKDHKK